MDWGRWGRFAVVVAIVVALVGLSAPARATYPGENGLIAFWSSSPSGGRIYAVESDGSGLVQLTPDDVNAFAPTFSADGTQILYSGIDAEGGGATYVMNVDGSNPTRLFDSITQGAAWSPDGSQIAYIADDPSPDDGGVIGVVDVDGTNQRRLTSFSGTYPFITWDRDPSWSPDGETIAFARHAGRWHYGSTSAAVFTVPAAGGSVREVQGTRHGDGTIVESPTWTPDGSAIVYDVAGGIGHPADPTPDPTAPGIHVVSLDSGTDTWLYDAGQHYGFGQFPEYSALISPDGSRIGFADHGRITLASSDGSGAEDIITSADGGPASFHEVEWQPVPDGDPVRDEVSVRISGAYDYENAGALRYGQTSVTSDDFGVARVSAKGAIDGVGGDTATVAISVNRLWILPLYTGSVDVADPGDVGPLRTPVLFGSVRATPDGATGASTWFTFDGRFRTYKLVWRVRDLI